MDRKPVILIVDDAASNIHLLSQLLIEDFHVKAANSGEKALQLARANPDLILLDIIMPGLDGYEACKRLKEDDRTRHIPVIFITGKSTSEDEEYGLSIGAVDYITKPIHPPIVMARVKNPY